MAGRKKGQSGANVHFQGKSARFLLTGNVAEYAPQWKFLDSLSGTQGAGSRAIMEGLRLLMDPERESKLDRVLRILTSQQEEEEELRTFVSGFME